MKDYPAVIEDWSTDLMRLNQELDEFECIGSTVSGRVEALIDAGVIDADERHDNPADWAFSIISSIIDRPESEQIFILESVSEGMDFLIWELSDLFDEDDK